MNFIKLFAFLNIFLVIAACSPQYKLQSILDRQIGKSKFLERTRLELDGILGKKDSKLKASILDLVEDQVKIEYLDTLIDGKKARIKVVAVVPKMDEINSLIMLASFLPREKMLEMTIQDIIIEVNKSSRKPASSSGYEGGACETYEFTVDFEKHKDWVLNSEQLSRAFSKRNLISKRL